MLKVLASLQSFFCLAYLPHECVIVEKNFNSLSNKTCIFRHLEHGKNDVRGRRHIRELKPRSLKEAECKSWVTNCRNFVRSGTAESISCQEKKRKVSSQVGRW